MQAVRGGVLGLDLSTRVGWCYGADATSEPIFGVWVLPPGDLGRRFGAFENEMLDAIDLFRPRLVVPEKPFLTARPGNGATLELQVGLVAIARTCCWHHEIPCEPVAAPSARAKVLGSARAPAGSPKGEIKRLVVQWCAERGWVVPDDNAGDAVVLWAHAVGIRAAGREELPFGAGSGRRRRQRAAMRAA